jgi:hypothetical protein
MELLFEEIIEPELLKQPCTIVSGVAANGVVWAGNNEDFIFDFETYPNVLPPDSGKFGAMFFTYGGPANFPQGGMNEKRLFFDLNAIPKVQREGYRDYGKRKAFPGGDTALLLHMLQTSATVNDALAGHYRSMGQALARGEGNQRAVQRRLSGSQQQKGAERDKPTKKHRLACVFHFQKPLGVR